MKSILTLGLITFALTFCGLGDKLKQLSSGANPGGNSSSSSSASSSSKSSSGSAEKPNPTAAQQAIIDSGTEVTWEQQGISWRLPANFDKQQVLKDTFNYGAPGV